MDKCWSLSIEGLYFQMSKIFQVLLHLACAAPVSGFKWFDHQSVGLIFMNSRLGDILQKSGPMIMLLGMTLLLVSC